MTLDELAIKYGTDKSSLGHGYMDTYQKHIGPLKNQKFTLLEIGTAGGASMRMWKEYFTEASIFGIDNNPSCLQDIFIGNQQDTKFLDDVLAMIGPIDVLIDDGSHMGSDQITTFRHIFPKLKSGAYYIIEDTHTFYCPAYAKDSKVFEFFSSLTSHVDILGKGMTGNVQTALNWHDPNPPVPEFSKDLACIHIYPSIWWFEKR